MTEQLYKIKPLEWRKQSPEMIIARHDYEMYSVRNNPKGFSLHCGPVFHGIYTTLEQAKEAAEKHYQDKLEQVLVRV